MRFVAYHQFHFQNSLSYANQAVELAQISSDHNLLAYALLMAGSTAYWTDQPHLMLQKLQEAERLLPKVAPPLQSYVLGRLAQAYAQNSHVSEAQDTIEKAYNLFTEDFSGTPYYISSDYSLSQLIINQGQTHLALGAKDVDRALTHYEHARSALASIDRLPPGTMIPLRNHIQILNHQAQAAIGVGNLEEAEHFLLAGIKGATALSSEKRRQEVLANWHAARKRWPQEKKVLALADIIHS